MELLLLIPFLVLVLIANVARTSVIAYRLTMVLSGLISACFIAVALGGAFFAVIGSPPAAEEPISRAALGAIAVTLGVTGAGSLLLLVTQVRQAIYSALRLAMATEEPVHTTALVMAVWLAGAMLATIFVSQQMGVAQMAPQRIQLSQVGAQGFLFVLLGALGVGLGLRRSWRETLARLGLKAVTLPQLGLAAVAIVGFVLWAVVVGGVWQMVDPQQSDRIGEISQLLFADVLTPLGAFVIGLSAGIGEETLFRGAIQPRLGIPLTTLLFTLSHTQYELSPSLLIVFSIGSGLALIRRYYSTTLAILVHAGYNTITVLLAGVAMGAQP